MGVVVVSCAAAGTGTFALDSLASMPTCTTMARAILLASIPGEEVSSPGPPPLRVTGGSSRRFAEARLRYAGGADCRPPPRRDP